jgi:hypothetical protein
MIIDILSWVLVTFPVWFLGLLLLAAVWADRRIR